jgi:hypothetical protein
MDFTVLTKRQIQFVLHQDNGDPDVKLLFEFLLVRFLALLFEFLDLVRRELGELIQNQH